MNLVCIIFLFFLFYMSEIYNKYDVCDLGIIEIPVHRMHNCWDEKITRKNFEMQMG